MFNITELLFCSMRREKPVLEWKVMNDIGVDVGLVEEQDVSEVEYFYI